MDSKDTGQGVAQSHAREWDQQVEQLLGDWRQRVYAAQTAHYASADMFRGLNYVVGIPAVILSSIVGTTIFKGLAKESAWAVWVGAASIAAAALAGLQTFLRFSERAAQHATAADWYSAIRRDIEESLHLPVELRGKAKDCLDRVRKEMNRAAQDAPELSTRFWKREARRFRVKNHLERSEPPQL
jgi:hypothetical protein